MSDIQLRNVIDADLPIFFEHQNDPEANVMAAFPPRDKGRFFLHWSQIMVDKNTILRTILYDGQVAGHVVSFVLKGEREVGYWIGREFWGRGIATSAMKQFLDVVTERPLCAHVAKHNIGSLRVLQKCGFKITSEEPFEGVNGGGQLEGYALILE